MIKKIKNLSTHKKALLAWLGLFLVFIVIVIASTIIDKVESEKYCTHQWNPATCTSPERCTLCGETIGTPSEHNFAEATCIELKTCKDCGVTEGTYSDHSFSNNTCVHCGYTITPASKWGFYDISKMDYALVQIVEYHLSDKNNRYVVATTDMRKFDGAYYLDWSFTVSGSKVNFGSTSNPRYLTIVNEENGIFGNGDPLTIYERKTISSYNNFVVYVLDEDGHYPQFSDWFIPYSLIDWERGATVYNGETPGGKYILYLK